VHARLSPDRNSGLGRCSAADPFCVPARPHVPSGPVRFDAIESVHEPFLPRGPVLDSSTSDASATSRRTGGRVVDFNPPVSSSKVSWRPLFIAVSRAVCLLEPIFFPATACCKSSRRRSTLVRNTQRPAVHTAIAERARSSSEPVARARRQRRTAFGRGESSAARDRCVHGRTQASSRATQPPPPASTQYAAPRADARSSSEYAVRPPRSRLLSTHPREPPDSDSRGAGSISGSHARAREPWGNGGATLLSAASGGSPRPRLGLRHTFATEALAAGLSLFELARVMGTSLRMVDRTYGHLAHDSEQAIRARLDARSGVEVASAEGR
jgi:hypothetical protein